MKQVTVSFTLNNRPVTATVPDDLVLVDYLQEEQNLSGTRLCCGIGVCKVCTVKSQRVPSAQGQPMLACSTPVRSCKAKASPRLKAWAARCSRARCSRRFWIILRFSVVTAHLAL